MKFSPSSSISSSTTSFSPNFCTSKGYALGCFSGFLSRILCPRSHPTYPSEIENQQQFSKIEKILDGSGTPNVVARLMGLEFMPEVSSKDDQKHRKSITRSKSMDSGDFRVETEEVQGQHRRVKTSFSFRETPHYFELEDDDFFVLNFENKDEKNKKGSNFGHSEVGNKHKRREKCRRKQRKNRDEQSRDRVFSDEERLSLKITPQHQQGVDNNLDFSKQSYHLSPFRDRISGVIDGVDEVKARKRKKKRENCLAVSKSEVECELENSSPVSVLDDSEFNSDHEVTTTSNYSEEDAKSRGSECDGRELSTSNNGNSQEEEEESETVGNGVKNGGLKRKSYRKRENIELLRRVCRLAEAELSNSNWKYRGIMLSTQDLEDAALDFSQHIFDQLISELLDQLLGL